ncbi:hypothetical protein L7F22_047678 [Adiantum nelumboides]|nr:hypothetical protein [Adiantum nelumboides]
MPPMDTHIVVKEMNSNNAINQSFTFSIFHNIPSSSVCQNRDYGLQQFATVHEQELDQDHCEHELFFDMDINMPFTWGDSHSALQRHRLMLQGNAAIESAEAGYPMEGSLFSSGAEDFEFHLAFSDNWSCCNDITEAISPADDLFYKGQLLPLHLPPRRRMVERLSSLDSNFQVEEEDFDAAAMDNVNVGHIPTVAELINEERHSVASYRGCKLITCEDKLQGGKALTSVGSTNAHAYRREDIEHDTSVFPGCYKDPALQLINGSDVNQYIDRRPSRRSSRSTMGCTVLLPSAKRFGCEDVAVWNENCRGFDLRQVKEARKRGLSLLKMRAPASFFKSLFTPKLELKSLFVQQNGNFPHCRSASRGEKPEDDDGDFEEEEETGDFLRYHIGRKHGYSIVQGRPVTITIKEPHERDKILKKARVCLQKYVKLFKSMYVLLSPTQQEQSRNLLESTSSLDEVSTCSSLSSSSSSRARQGSVTSNSMEAKTATKNSMSLESLRTTSFLKRSRRNWDTVQGSLVNCKSHRDVRTARFYGGAAAGNVILPDMSCGTSCLEVENPIQGAIAHCKQSSALSSL